MTFFCLWLAGVIALFVEFAAHDLRGRDGARPSRKGCVR